MNKIVVLKILGCMLLLACNNISYSSNITDSTIKNETIENNENISSKYNELTENLEKLNNQYKSLYYTLYRRPFNWNDTSIIDSLLFKLKWFVFTKKEQLQSSTNELISRCNDISKQCTKIIEYFDLATPEEKQNFKNDRHYRNSSYFIRSTIKKLESQDAQTVNNSKELFANIKTVCKEIEAILPKVKQILLQ